MEIDGGEAPNDIVGISKLEGCVLQLQATMWHLLIVTCGNHPLLLDDA